MYRHIDQLRECKNRFGLHLAANLSDFLHYQIGIAFNFGIGRPGSETRIEREEKERKGLVSLITKQLAISS